MKRNNKKGFTIVELVIVIAVIAILSAVLIPTFGGITNKAQETARDQEAKNLYTQYLGNWDYTTGDPVENGYVVVDEYAYEVVDGNLSLEEEKKAVAADDVIVHNEACSEVKVGATGHDHKCDVCGAKIDCNKTDSETCNYTESN